MCYLLHSPYIFLRGWQVTTLGITRNLWVFFVPPRGATDCLVQDPEEVYEFGYKSLYLHSSLSSWVSMSCITLSWRTTVFSTVPPSTKVPVISNNPRRNLYCSLGVRCLRISFIFYLVGVRPLGYIISNLFRASYSCLSLIVRWSSSTIFCWAFRLHQKRKDGDFR